MSIAKSVIEDGVPYSGFETKRLTKQGALLDVSMSASRFDDHKSNAAGILVVFRDITQTKRLQSQLQEAQKMQALGTLAGGIAHDFNNLLMGIQGYVSLLLLGMEGDHARSETLRKIEEQIRSAAALTKQLLGLARGGKYEPKVIDLRGIVESTAHVFARTHKEIRMITKCQDDTWSVEADQSQMEQVLLNLYVNAWQAMPSGGTLTVQTQNIEYRKRDVPELAPNMPPGRYVRTSVTDTGVGMDRDTQQRIFEPFFTTKDKERGTGLGLASAYGIVRNHGGYIHVQSELGVGSTFHMFLPASGKSPHMDKPTASNLVRGSETILLVDDEPAVLEVAERILSVLGYRVLTAGSGQKAIETFARSQDGIDLVVLDMIMPRMGGGETFDELKRINPRVKVLLSSGYSVDGQASEILARGCDGFIQKPYNMLEFSKKVRAILDEKTGDAGTGTESQPEEPSPHRVPDFQTAN